MNKYTQVPPILLARAIRLFLKRRIHFPKEQIGDILQEKEDFIVFRKVLIDPSEKFETDQKVILKIYFRFKSFSLETNKKLSLIPIPFIIAQPGFISKTWMSGKSTGTFHGLYEWQDEESARKYLDSFPMELMKKRAVSGTLVYNIVDQEKEMTAN